MENLRILIVEDEFIIASNLKMILEELGCTSFKVIIYLRNPVDFAESLYSTQIKSGSVAEMPVFPDYLNVLDHKSTMLRYSEVFGFENIFPRIFEKEHFLNGSILEDFSNCIDDHHNFHQYKIPPNLNESLSPLALGVLCRLNQSIPAFIDHLPNPQRQGLVEQVSRFLNHGKFTLPTSVRYQYDMALSDSNEWVRATFFPHLPSLFQPKVSPHEPCTVSAEELDQIAALIAHIWMHRD
jgi:CheY-like chemotaxis protein